MRTTAYTLAVVGVVATVAMVAVNDLAGTSLYNIEITQDNVDFANYLAKHGKSYATKEEFEFRFAQFQRNRALIGHHNAQNGNTYSLGVNKFADMTTSEYKKMLGYRRVPKNDLPAHFDTSDLPASIDWREKGAVNPVKDQGQCGSCWAFSTTGALEGRDAIATGTLKSFSEQQLVDCDRKENAGCNGGDMGLAMDYASQNPLELESEYGYKAVDGTCKYDKSKGESKNSGHKDVTPASKDQLKAAVAQGPVSVAIEADTLVFQFYQGGILNNSGCGTNLDHGVLAVGYGTENGQDYFIVKNSWGASWGEKGYIRIAAVDGNGICGIQMAPVFPTI